MQPLEVYHVGDVIAKHYHVLSIRGQGTFGVVYECQHSTSQEKVAIKQSRLQLQTEGISPIVLREISILKQLQHDNILRLKTDPIFLLPNLFLVFELLDMDLRNYLETANPEQMPPQKIKSIMSQLVKAVHFCHSAKIIHRDISPKNILLNKQGLLKLADFGLARYITYPAKPLTEQVVTLWYRAPELLKGTPLYGLAVDIWSVGCIFAELVFGKVFFKGETEVDQMNLIFETMGSPTLQSWPNYFQNMEMQDEKVHTNELFQKMLVQSGLSPQGCDLMARMLALNPQHRISALDALNHPYFNS